MIALLILPVLIGLGFWQLQRFDAKTRLVAYRAMQQAQVFDSLINIAALSSESINFTKLNLEGYFLNPYIVFLDNRTYRGKVGYEVIMPFKTIDDHLIWVNRGWVKADVDRNQLPLIEPIHDRVKIQGFIFIPNFDTPVLNSSEAIKQNALMQDWPIRTQKIDPFKLNDRLKIQLTKSDSDRIGEIFPHIMRLNPYSPNAFEIQWQQQEIPPERHLAYAVQWFAIAFTFFMVYLAMQIKRYRPQN